VSTENAFRCAKSPELWHCLLLMTQLWKAIRIVATVPAIRTMMPHTASIGGGAGRGGNQLGADLACRARKTDTSGFTR
jgi:hypothetical protein